MNQKKRGVRCTVALATGCLPGVNGKPINFDFLWLKISTEGARRPEPGVPLGAVAPNQQVVL